MAWREASSPVFAVTSRAGLDGSVKLVRESSAMNVETLACLVTLKLLYAQRKKTKWSTCYNLTTLINCLRMQPPLAHFLNVLLAHCNTNVNQVAARLLRPTDANLCPTIGSLTLPKPFGILYVPKPFSGHWAQPWWNEMVLFPTKRHMNFLRISKLLMKLVLYVILSSLHGCFFKAKIHY